MPKIWHTTPISFSNKKGLNVQSRLTLRKIFQTVESSLIEKANRCKVNLQEVLANNEVISIKDLESAINSEILFVFSTALRKKEYNTIIQFEEGLSIDSTVKIRCNCPYFILGYSLIHIANNSFYGPIEQNILQLSTFTVNKNMLPSICEHLLASILYLVESKILEV